MTPEHQEQALVRLHRPAAGTAGLRRVQVLIDGHVAAHLAEGETAEYPVSPEVHRLWAHMDWASDQQVDLDIAVGETVDLLVVAAGTALSPVRNQVPSQAFTVRSAPGTQARLRPVVAGTGASPRLSMRNGIVLATAGSVFVLVLLLAVGVLG